jgi:hypothetical protein
MSSSEDEGQEIEAKFGGGDDKEMCENNEVDSQHMALWGLPLVAQLERPAGISVTLAISALLLCAMSWHRMQMAYHVLFIAAVLHVYFPWLYRVAYSARALEVQALAGRSGVQRELCIRRLAFRQVS